MKKVTIAADSTCDLSKELLEKYEVDILPLHIHREGRCSRLAALAGGTLKLHPYIEVKDGKLQPGKKYRGRMNKVLMEYVSDLKPSLEKAKKERVFITHSGCEQTLIDTIQMELEAMDYFDEILVTRAGSVITSHCGPGTLGVLFIEE